MFLGLLLDGSSSKAAHVTDSRPVNFGKLCKQYIFCHVKIQLARPTPITVSTTNNGFCLVHQFQTALKEERLS